jgi:hypothetical protein
MAVRTSASSQNYYTTLSLGTQTQVSVTCWIKLNADRNNNSTMWWLEGAAGDFLTLVTDANGTTASIFDNNSGILAGISMAVGTWYFHGVTYDAGTYTMISRALGGTSFSSYTTSLGAASHVVTSLFIQNGQAGGGGGPFLNGCITALKGWVGLAMTEAQLENEAWTHIPRHPNPTFWYPLLKTETTDYSGNGRTLSGGSGATIEDGPGVGWGSRHVHLPILEVAGVTYEQSVGGLLTPTSVLTPTKVFGQTMAASSLPEAEIVWLPGRSLAAGATPTAATVSAASRALGGASSPSANLANQPNLTILGELVPVGEDPGNLLTRPDGTITQGTWTAVGGPATLWDCMNEVAPVDTDYAQSAALTTGTDTCEVSLSNASDPNLSRDHAVRYRYAKNSSGGRQLDLTVSLRQGATQIAAWTHVNISNVFANAEQTLTAVQTDAITDYTDMRLRFVVQGIGTSGTSRRGRISWAEFQVPFGTAYTLGMDGSMAPAGTTRRQPNKALAAAMASVGSLIRQAQRALGGTIAPGGILTAAGLAFQGVEGVLALAGAIAKRAARALGGGSSPTSLISRAASKLFGGPITPAGSRSAAATRIVSGAAASAGVMAKDARRSLEGSAPSAGNLVRFTSRSLAGSVPPAGAMTKLLGRGIAGSAASTGTLLRTQLFVRAFGGIASPSGALASSASRQLAGTTAVGGSLARHSSRSLTGNVAPQGTNLRRADRLVAGSIVPVGATYTAFGKLLAGAATPTSVLSRHEARLLNGGIVPAGSELKRPARLVTGSFSGAGILLTLLTQPAKPGRVSVTVERAEVGLSAEWLGSSP